MSQNEQGVLYPFRLTGSRMRRSAQQLRRHGQALDAVALVRRAAEQDDTPAAWMALAEEMCHTGNWEAAVKLLARVLSRDAHHPGAWTALAQCLHHLGQTPLAVDCAYHQLQEDPWSSEGDAARALLAEIDVPQARHESGRLQRMVHRGMTAWQSGDRAAGERIIRRALKLSADKERLLVTTAMMCMLEMDFEGALHYLPRALRYSPTDPRTLTALATLYHQLGKRRLSRGFLQKAGQYAESVMAEDGFLSAAWAQDAWTDMNEYLTRRMKRTPYRIALMGAKATMCCENGDLPAAQQLWREILGIDPEDRQSAAMMAWSQAQPESFLCVPGMIPRPERQKQMTELHMAAEILDMAQLLRHGSRERRLLDWALESSEPIERQHAMALLETAEGTSLIAYLKELLCRPFLRMEVRQWALVRLAQLGCREEMLMMAGPHYTLVQCQPVEESRPQEPWRIFLPAFLHETRKHCAANEMAEYAASIWPLMTLEQHMDAIGAGKLAWCKALEVFWLRKNGEYAHAEGVMRSAGVSPRRIGRVMRSLARNLETE